MYKKLYFPPCKYTELVVNFYCIWKARTRALGSWKTQSSSPCLVYGEALENFYFLVKGTEMESIWGKVLRKNLTIRQQQRNLCNSCYKIQRSLVNNYRASECTEDLYNLLLYALNHWLWLSQPAYCMNSFSHSLILSHMVHVPAMRTKWHTYPK